MNLVAVRDVVTAAKEAVVTFVCRLPEMCSWASAVSFCYYTLEDEGC
jgi:hypothetical protein